MTLKKLNNIDLIRLIASFLVVAIHTYPLSSFNDSLDYLFTRVIFRIAVPIFLMITGYYVLPKSLKSKIYLRKYIIKILKIYGVCVLIYLPLNIYNNYFSNLNLFSLIKDLLINGIFYHLWYFPALILGLFLTYFLLKKSNKKFIIIIVLFLYIIGLLGDSYYGLTINFNFLYKFYEFIFKFSTFTRNAFFMPQFFFT